MLHKLPGISWTTRSIRKLYDQMGTLAHSTYADAILALFFFIEAMFFFPADPLLILFCVERPKKSFYYATIATIFSVIGGIAAYHIGMFIWAAVGQKMVTLFTTPETFEYLCTQYRTYQNYAVLASGLTPVVPYKAITLTAGFCRLPLVPFIICSLIARGARFYLIGAVVYWWGIEVKLFIDAHFNKLVLAFVTLVLGMLLILKA